MFRLGTMILSILCIAPLCLMSQAVTTTQKYTIEVDSHNETSSPTALGTFWDIEWGPLPNNSVDMNTILWYRLSQSNGVVDIETLDDLQECLSGGKHCKDVLPKNLSGPLSLLTNCTINSDLSPELCNALQKCTNISGLLPPLGLDSRSVTPSELDTIIPFLVYQISEGYCQAKDNDSPFKKTKDKPTPAEVWGYGFLFVTIISVCSLAGVSMLPLIGRQFYQHLLTTLVGLAMGSLAASSLFHLIPEAFHLHDVTGSNDYLFTSLYVLLGIWGFFMIERLIKIISENCSKQNKEKKSLPIADSTHPMLHNSNSTCESHNVKQIYQTQEQAIKNPGKDDHHSHPIEFNQEKDSVIRTVAWMIIFGDGFHNFIDGVSIGAAFSKSTLTGVSISLAVMAEELPHELGDFAVLLNSGMTMKQAVMYNFLSATTCYIGLVLGILLGEFTENITAVFAIAAGMFLYIALSDMIPEMNKTASEATHKGVSAALWVLFLQNIGVFLGIGSLFLLAYFEESITIL